MHKPSDAYFAIGFILNHFSVSIIFTDEFSFKVSSMSK
jgi:hypothetical protein